MPIKKGLVVYSAPVKLKNGLTTLGLFDKNHKLVDLRVCQYHKSTNHFSCPRQSTQPKERKKLAKKLGIKQ